MKERNAVMTSSAVNQSPLPACAWLLKHEIERQYHDAVWGIPVYDDRVLFEFLTLEGAQAGLSWLTILQKRAAYRRAFVEFDIDTLATYGEAQMEAIIAHHDVVKNRRKIASVFTNAQAVQKLQQEFGSFAQALWQFVDGVPRINHWRSRDEVPVFTPESQAMSRFLKKHGFKFVGDTICYSLMQATGMVNDHLVSCERHQAIQQLNIS